MKPDLAKRFVDSPVSKILATIVGAIAILSLTIFGGIVIVNNRDMTLGGKPFGQSEIRVEGKSAKLNIEIADEPAKWQQGLMNRNTLAPDAGMLFVFPFSQELEFWMKDTFISLDIIFLDSNMIVTTIHKATKPNQTSEKYKSNGAAMYVLETNAGWSSKNNIEIGDKMLLPNSLP